MENVTINSIKDKETQIARYNETIKHLERIRAPITLHKGKLVDARFFAAHFTEKWPSWKEGETRDYVPYQIRKPSYVFSETYPLELYVSGDCKIQLESRETKDVLKAIDTELEKTTSWRNGSIVSRDKLKLIDEPAIIADILAVYNKHGKPDTWGKILETYEVKYPTK
jgi:hypothetical protein